MIPIICTLANVLHYDQQTESIILHNFCVPSSDTENRLNKCCMRNCNLSLVTRQIKVVLCTLHFLMQVFLNSQVCFLHFSVKSWDLFHCKTWNAIMRIKFCSGVQQRMIRLKLEFKFSKKLQFSFFSLIFMLPHLNSKSKNVFC